MRSLCFAGYASEDVAAHVLVLREPCELLSDIGAIDGEGLAGMIGGVERDGLEQPLHHRVQAACTDVLGALVDRPGDLGEAADAVVVKLQRHTLGREQRAVLLGERGVGLGEDAHEVVDREGIQFDADGETPLQLRNEVRRLREMKGARGDEQDVISAHDAVLGGDGAALDQRQQIALHTLARDVGAAVFTALGDLVDLIEEHDAVLLDVAQRACLQVLVGEQLECLFHAQATAASARARHVLKQALQLGGHFLHAGRRHDLHAHRRNTDLDLDLLVVELTLTQLFAEDLARSRLLGGLARAEAAAQPRQQRLEHTLLRRVLGARAHLGERLFARQRDRDVDEIAHDGFDTAADVTDLGELGRLDLDEGRIGELGEPPRDLGLADAGGADHQDVFRRDLVAQLLVDLRTPPAVAQRDRDRALGLGLTDDVFVELLHDLSGGHIGHMLLNLSPYECVVNIRYHRAHSAASSSSMVKWWLVYTQMSAATERARSTMARASSSVFSMSARAAACAKGPPDPMAARLCSGSMTSPLPEIIKEACLSATTNMASSRRSMRSVRQSFASSTAARSWLPECFSSLPSKRSNKVKASAVPPANPAMTRSP